MTDKRGVEAGSEYYDGIFSRPEGWYRGRWRTACERYVPPIHEWISRRVIEPVLDLGCGPGFLAAMLLEKGVKNYVGIDFSRVALRQAGEKTPYTYHLADLREIKSLEEFLPDAKTIVLCETLEHLEEDFRLCSLIPLDVRVVGSVPQGWAKSHVRCFPEKESFLDRYSSLFTFDEVDQVASSWVFVGARRK